MKRVLISVAVALVVPLGACAVGDATRMSPMQLAEERAQRQAEATVPVSGQVIAAEQAQYRDMIDAAITSGRGPH